MNLCIRRKKPSFTKWFVSASLETGFYECYCCKGGPLNLRDSKIKGPSEVIIAALAQSVINITRTLIMTKGQLSDGRARTLL